MNERILQKPAIIPEGLHPTAFRIPGCFALPLVLFFLLSTNTIHAPPPDNVIDRLTLRFLLQEVEVDPERQAQLRVFSSRNSLKEPYILVQGFACDTGGYDISVRVARQRGEAVTGVLGAYISAGFPDAIARRIRAADPVVLHGSGSNGREQYRRAEIRSFRTAGELQTALANANQAAAKWNQAAQQALSAETVSAPKVEKNTQRVGEPRSAWELHFLFGMLLMFLLLIGLIALYLSRRTNSSQHRLTPDEAEALEILTGGAVVPVPPEPDTTGTESQILAEVSPAQNQKALVTAAGLAAKGRLVKFMNEARNQSMGAKKKSKSKITPISIRGAVDRDFEEKSLAELSRSPIDALEGLTPRHARMLEEAFGIKTVEDLARLKYVEIARAIVVLSRYEK